ncbi:mitochondrial 54S ribosomal protein YmL35 [Martiniozyma asiatica (nom. inval.)]|nr:mitochondrial 54S ribosomal protein YmL35 [Martiniozyma asiatica]
MSAPVSRRIWSNFKNRSSSLAVKSKALQGALLSANLPNGPVSYKSNSRKRQYTSPIGLDGVYPMAYEILEKESEKIYQKISTIEESLEKEQDIEKLNQLKTQWESLQVEAEKFNPEVIYNAEYATNSVDRSQPVYRHFLKQKWIDYKRMLTMQRLETLKIIPDTLPTLSPEVDVQLKFPHNNVETLIEPGVVLSSNATSRPPAIEVIEFKESINDLYTVLIVDPDTPDVANDSFSTTLCWGLQNVKLSNNDSWISAKKLTEQPDCEFSEYLPSVPEKNSGKHRYAVWIFRQNGQSAIPKDIPKENFNIRNFVKENNLKAVGAHVWRSVWDMNTENVRDLYGLPAGRIFSRERS